MAYVTPERLDAAGVRAALDDLAGWSGDRSAIRRTVRFPSFAVAIEAVRAVAEVAERDDHHPDIDIRFRELTFACTTYSAGGVTSKDVTLAGHIDRICTALGGE